MKKKFVSSIVFMMLVAGFQARAQEVAVDKGVVVVENEASPSAISDFPIYKFKCVENVEVNPSTVNAQYMSENDSKLIKIILNNVPGLEKNLEFLTEEKIESSFLYEVHKFELADQAKNVVGEFTISKINHSMTRGGSGVFCGRAGCDAQPNFNYDAILKIYEKEISFTCK